MEYRYSLLGDKAERFSADPDTGEVFTTIPLDREQTAVYHLTLVAQDSSPTEPRASAVNLTIFVTDVNDNPPHFSSPRYTAYIPGATKPGNEISNYYNIVHACRGKKSSPSVLLFKC